MYVSGAVMLKTFCILKYPLFLCTGNISDGLAFSYAPSKFSQHLHVPCLFLLIHGKKTQNIIYFPDC